MTSERDNKIGEDKNFSGEVVDFLKDLVIITIIVMVIRTFFVMPFQINGQSMYSSYYDKEFIIVDRFSYLISEPTRGDVVVFKPHVNKEKEFFLKRIIGMPGDSLRIENGKVFLKEKGEELYIELDETYLDTSNKGFTFISGSREKFDYMIPEGKYYVMGDNRNHSTDSRHCFSSCSIEERSNFVEKSDFTGKVFIDLGYFSFSTFSFLHPSLGIVTKPRFLDSPRNFEY